MQTERVRRAVLRLVRRVFARGRACASQKRKPGPLPLRNYGHEESRVREIVKDAHDYKHG